MFLCIACVVIAILGLAIAVSAFNPWWFIMCGLGVAGAITCGSHSAPTVPVTLPLRPVVSIMYAVDLRAVGQGVMASVVGDDGQPYFVNFANATIRQVEGPPEVLLSRRQPNPWYEAGSPHFKNPEVRVPVGTVIAMDKMPPFVQGNLLY